MNHHAAQLHEIAALATAEYYRVLGLFYKHKSVANENRVLEQKLLASKLMREALRAKQKQ